MLAVDSPLAAYLAAAEAHDVPGMVARMAPGATLTSPITDRFAFRGHEQMTRLLEDVYASVTDVRYTADIGDDRMRFVTLEARAGRERFDEAMVVTLDDEGLITSMKLYVRPMPGLTGLAAALGPRVARRHGRLRALAVRLMIAPLAFMSSSGEGVASRLAAP